MKQCKVAEADVNVGVHVSPRPAGVGVQSRPIAALRDALGGGKWAQMPPANFDGCIHVLVCLPGGMVPVVRAKEVNPCGRGKIP